MSKIKKSDEVIVITGKDKGRRGLVLARIDARFLTVDGVNTVKRATKPNPAKNQLGGLIDKNLPIDVSNIAIFNPLTKKADRVGYKMVDGKKLRVFKSNGEAIGN